MFTCGCLSSYIGVLHQQSCSSSIVLLTSGPPPVPPHACRLTGLCEAAGYACVIYCIKQSGQASLFGPFVAKQLFLLLSPNLLQANARGGRVCLPQFCR